MSEIFWLGFASGVFVGGLLGLLLAGLLRMSSDLELRMAHHVRENDEHTYGLNEKEDLTK